MNSNNNNGYFRVQDRLFDWYGQLLGPIAIAVYNYLARCADQDGCCFPSYEDIARKVGISRRAAIMAIAKLGRYGLIEIQHRKNRREKRGNYTSNRYKIRLEAFTHAGAHREVVHEVHQVVHEVHSKDYPLKDNPNKGREKEPDPLPVFSNSPKVGENVKAATVQSPGGESGLSCQNQAVKIATTGRGRRHQGNNGAGQPSPVPWPLLDGDIKAVMQETGWSEAKVKDEAPKFRDHHLSKGTLSCDWLAQWRIWKRRGDEWEGREREHVRANGKVERTPPRPPLYVAEPRVPIDPSKPRPSLLSHISQV